jgi:hypothetical protein
MRTVWSGGRMRSLLLGSVFAAATLGCGTDGKSTPTPSADDCVDDGGPADADADTGEPLPEAGACQALYFSETFEGFTEGAALDTAWELVVEGPNSSARVNLDAEGHGNAGSNRFALFTNAGSAGTPVEISATTPTFDVRGCTSVTLTASVVVFSFENTENDHAFVEVRGNGRDWIPMYMPFPSPEVPADAGCRVGGQETGCTAWRTLTVDVPRVALGPDLELRFRVQTLTDVSDFFGFDDVSLAGVP